MKKILILDNYDSFTYNLVQYIEEITQQSVAVFRNDEITLDAVDDYDTIILSPGPGLPSEAGIMPALIQRYAPTKNIFGVCLGQQAIGEAFGGTLHNLADVYHGVATPILVKDTKEPIFKGLGKRFVAGRYHSWVVKQDDFPKILKITAVDENGQIMALRHRKYNVCGVQFHPESIMTPEGKRILENFLIPSPTLPKGEGAAKQAKLRN
jgi:anthranilate synthase component II